MAFYPTTEEQMEALRLSERALLEENAALKRTVEDLAHALRKANARLVNIARMAQDAAVAPEKEEDAFRLIYNEAYSGELRKVLDRHGLLRDVDRPEMTQAFRDEMAAERASDEAARAGTYETPCRDCGANAYEPCTPTCKDRR